MTWPGKLRVKYALIYTAWFGIMLWAMPKAAHFLDIPFWRRWSTYIFEHGLSNVYQVEDNNYNPLFHYFLYVFGLLAGSTVGIANKIYWIKAFPLVFDFVGALAAVSFVKGTQRRFALSFWLLLNIGYLYNSWVWGQVDSIYTCFVFFAAAFALRGKPIGSLVFYVLAINAKTQAIIFLPPLLLLWIPLWLQSGKKFPLAVLSAAAVQFLILIPFIWFGDENYVRHIIDINFNAVGFYKVISMGAYNFWHLVTQHFGITIQSDDLIVAGLTYRNWGLILFCLSSFIVLLPLFVITVRNLLAPDQAVPVERSLVFITFALIPICFCYFNTEMHSRYWHAALLFLAAYSFVTNRYFVFVLCSVAYLLNLESVLKFLQENYHLYIEHNPLLNHRAISILFTLVLLMGLVELYRLVDVRLHVREGINNLFSSRKATSPNA